MATKKRQIYNKKHFEEVKAKGMCPSHPITPVVFGHTVCRNCHAELHFEIGNHTENIFKWYNLQDKINFNKCNICGYNKCIAVIDGHHINPENKEFGLAELKRNSFNYNNMIIFLNEIKKCIPMCKNCHTELEKEKRTNAI